MKREDLAAFLQNKCRGRKNAMSAERIMAVTHTHRSVLGEQINKLRQEEVPIASGKEGYFYAETAGDIYATIKFLRKLQESIEKTIRGLEAALAHFGERDTP